MLILEFSNDRIKLLEVLKKGKKTTLAHLASKAVSGPSEEEVYAVLFELLKEAGVKKGTSVVMSIMRSQATVRNLRLPSVEESELKGMVALQAGKLLPFPASDLTWDFQIIEKKDDGYSDVFLIIVYKNVVDKFIACLKRAMLDVDRIIISTEALTAWHAALPGLPEGKIKSLIDVDSAYMDMVIMRDQKVEFSRTFAFKADMEEGIVDDIVKTFAAYQKDAPSWLSSIVLTGIQERATALEGLLKKAYPSVNIQYVHPLQAVSSYSKEPAEAACLEQSREASFSSVLGIAYNYPAITMDFMPAELSEAKLQGQKKKILLKTGILSAVILIVSAGIFGRYLMEENRELALINSRIKETEPRVKRLKEISQNIEMIKKHLDMKGSAADIIREVFSLIPSRVSLSVFDYELDTMVTLRGVAGDSDSVFKFADDINKSSYFNKCQIKYAQKRMVKTSEVVDFELSCGLGPRKGKDKDKK